MGTGGQYPAQPQCRLQHQGTGNIWHPCFRMPAGPKAVPPGCRKCTSICLRAAEKAQMGDGHHGNASRSSWHCFACIALMRHNMFGIQHTLSNIHCCKLMLITTGENGASVAVHFDPCRATHCMNSAHEDEATHCSHNEAQQQEQQNFLHAAMGLRLKQPHLCCWLSRAVCCCLAVTESTICVLDSHFRKVLFQGHGPLLLFWIRSFLLVVALSRPYCCAVCISRHSRAP